MWSLGTLELVINRSNPVGEQYKGVAVSCLLVTEPLVYCQGCEQGHQLILAKFKNRLHNAWPGSSLMDQTLSKGESLTSMA